MLKKYIWKYVYIAPSLILLIASLAALVTLLWAAPVIMQIGR